MSSHHLHFANFFAIVVVCMLQLTASARSSTYTPLSDQTYQDILRQQQQYAAQQSQLEQQQQQQQRRQQRLLQQQRQQQEQQQLEEIRYRPTQNYETDFRYNNQPREDDARNFRNFEDFQYARPQQQNQRQIQLLQQQQRQEFLRQQQQQLPIYQRPQIWSGRPLLATTTLEFSPQQQLQQSFFPVTNSDDLYQSRGNFGIYRPTSPTTTNFQGNNLRSSPTPPQYYSENDFYARQNQIGLPSARDFVQLSAEGLQLNHRPTTNADYAAHFDSYLRKYPQRLEPRYGVQNYL